MVSIEMCDCLKMAAGELRHPAALGIVIFGNIQRLDHALEAFSDRSSACAEQPPNAKTQLKNAKAAVQKPFSQEAELAEKTKRLDELIILLNMDKRETKSWTVRAAMTSFQQAHKRDRSMIIICTEEFLSADYISKTLLTKLSQSNILLHIK